MNRYTRNKNTGRTEKEYGAFCGSTLGYVLQPVKEDHTELFRGLPSFNNAVVEDIKSLQAQKLAEAMYYQRNTTRFD